MNPKNPQKPIHAPKDAAAIDALNHKITDLSDKLARALADYANLEKRIDSQRQLFANLATANMLNKLVPVLDDLYLAQSHLNDHGLKLTMDKLKQLIKSEGIEEINPENELYDATTMTCIGTQEGQDNMVLIVHKLGYKLNDQVIRPAEVVVGKSKSKD
jgi:molecular chaperone GrpE